MSPRTGFMLCMSLLVMGCTATETGNPVASQRLALTAISSRSEVQLKSEAGGVVTIEQAWVVLGDIRFVSSTDCDRDGDERTDIPGPSVVELIGDAEPLTFAVEEQRYCRVRVPLERADEIPARAPDDLEDHVVLLVGSLPDGTPLVVRSRDKREAEVRSREQPFQLREGGVDLLLVFDIGRWLQDLDLDSAERDDDGRVVVDHETNEDRLDTFEDNLRDALELFRDLDGNGRLDDVERARSLATGG